VYIPLSRELQQYADANGINYVYSFIQRGDRIVFFISSNTDSQFAAQDFVGFGKPYDEASVSLRRCFAEGGVVVEDTSDEYGSWRSALVRKQAADGRSYVLCADIDVRHVDRLLRMTLIRSAVIGLIGFVLFLIVILKIADSITVPLVRLEEQTRRIVDGHFDIDKFDTSVLESIWKRFRDESGRLAFAFLTMLNDLSEHIKKLEHETSLRNRAESEMKLAGEIQRSYLPGPLADSTLLGRLNLYGDSRPARSAGGDLYDYALVDGKRLVFAVGDVSDKGMPAAMFMAICVTLLREAALHDSSPVAIANAVNASLVRHNDLCQFVTLFLGVLDLDTGEAQCVNAGHNPPYIRRADGRLERLNERHGPAMGVMAGVTYGHGSFRLGLGDMLVMYTDGVTEAFDDKGKLYSEARLRTSIESLGTAAPREFTTALLEDVVRYANGAPQSDDITIMALRRTAA
jgi:sigma-B regulation protein RsbU (phosphoserine phosphatase)